MHSFCLFVAAFTTLISQSLFVWRLRLFGIYQSIHPSIQTFPAAPAGLGAALRLGF